MAGNDKPKTTGSDAARQYMDIYAQCRDMIHSHSCDVMNAPRDAAYDDFCRQGLPTRKVERYKYTDMAPLCPRKPVNTR